MFNQEIKLELKEVINKLNKIDSTFVKNNISSHFIQFIIDENDDAILEGNSEGLLHVAKKILELVIRDVIGADEHFDESGMLNKADKNLIVILTKPEWENNRSGLPHLNFL